MNVKKLRLKYVFLGLCVIAVLGVAYFYTQNTRQSLTYNEFITAVSEGRIENVTFGTNDQYFSVQLTDQNGVHKVPNLQNHDFMDYLLANNVPVIYSDSSGTSPIIQVLLLAAIAGGIIFFRFRSTGDQLIKDATAKNKHLVSLTLQNVAGNAEAKDMVTDIIQFIKNPEKYSHIGAKMPHGILFYGPPGTGKTLMAKAIAGEAGVPFYPMSGSDFIQMYVGVGASRIRSLFKTARKAEKAVIFIDEIDAIGKRRGQRSDSGNDERDRTLNALLTEMSGFNGREGIVVIAATNRLDVLDEALTRPGRFDRLVEIGLPDLNARKKILKLHAEGKCLSPAVDMSAVAKSTVSFSGSMLENLINEAAILAANAGSEQIEPAHMDKAFYMVIAGAEKTDTSCITEHDRSITAYHEAGHALATHLLLPGSYISKVTIIPSTRGAGGFSLSIPEDTLYLTKQKLLANLKVLLAGRASEELIFGGDDITTGASNDIEKASGMVLNFINKYGMDEEFGLFNSDVLGGMPESALTDLCRKRLKELYQETLKLLEENRQFLEDIARKLLDKETLNGEDIEKICA